MTNIQIVENRHIFSKKFEWGDMRCGNCMSLAKGKSGKICNCICHLEINPYEKFH